MKKAIALVLLLVLVAGGVQAQNRGNNKNSRKVPPSMVNSNAPKSIANATTDVRQLPAPVEGMDAPLIFALQQRRTIRNIREEELPIGLVSSLLWSAYGINRPEEGRRVAPSAVNVQEFDIYLFDRQGIYLYNAEKNTLSMVTEGDHRAEISQQKHFAQAPVSIVLVANYDRMKVFKEKDVRDFYAAVDCGYISQNIYLFCSSAKLATVACGAIEREHLEKLIGIKNGKALIAHPVGFPVE